MLLLLHVSSFFEPLPLPSFFELDDIGNLRINSLKWLIQLLNPSGASFLFVLSKPSTGSLPMLVRTRASRGGQGLLHPLAFDSTDSYRGVHHSRPTSKTPVSERLIPNFRVASKLNSVENHVVTFGDEVISDGHVTYEYVGTLNGATGWMRKASLAQAFERSDF
ncbi:hypothetical protein ACFXTN_020024 [Malus domestica]